MILYLQRYCRKGGLDDTKNSRRVRKQFIILCAVINRTYRNNIYIRYHCYYCRPCNWNMDITKRENGKFGDICGEYCLYDTVYSSVRVSHFFHRGGEYDGYHCTYYLCLVTYCSWYLCRDYHH